MFEVYCLKIVGEILENKYEGVSITCDNRKPPEIG